MIFSFFPSQRGQITEAEEGGEGKVEVAGEEGGEAMVEDGEETHLGDMKTKEMSTSAKQCLELVIKL